MGSWRKPGKRSRVGHGSKVPRCAIQVFERTSGEPRKSKNFTVYVPMSDVVKQILKMVDENKMATFPPGRTRG